MKKNTTPLKYNEELMRIETEIKLLQEKYPQKSKLNEILELIQKLQLEPNNTLLLEKLKELDKGLYDRILKAKEKAKADETEAEKKEADLIIKTTDSNATKERLGYIEDYTNTRLELFFENIDFGRLDFLDSISKTIKELKKEGITTQDIAQRLYNNLETSLDSLFNQEANKIWDLEKSISQYAVFAGLEDESNYKWVLEDSAKHCNGCLKRSGQIKTFQEWESEGLPGSGVTECDSNCLCGLVEIVKKRI